MELTTELNDLRKIKPLPKIPNHKPTFMDDYLDMYQLYYTTDPSLNYVNSPYSLDVLAQMAQYTEHVQSKDIPLLPIDASSITGELFSVSETYFQPSPASSRIPSPWSTSSSKRSRERVERISTGSVPTLSVTLSQVTNEVEYSKADIHSLAQIRLNIKLYRRMAIKTRDQGTQMAYAKYLLSMAKVCPVGSKDTQEALVDEASYWIQRLTKVGCPEALFIKAKWYLLGPQADFARGHEQVQENKALRYFERASKAGWAEANYELAQIWKRRGCYQKAIQYYERGAKENHTPSIYKMAKIMLRGQLESTKNLEKGLEYLQRAADMKDSESAEAAFVLGCIYANDLERVGIQKDIPSVYEDINKSAKDNLAFQYLKKSFNDGYPDAIHYMGQILEIGILGQGCDEPCWICLVYTFKVFQDYYRLKKKMRSNGVNDLQI
ncbi:unnamed protein product [Rhizopus stolonifer]